MANKVKFGLKNVYYAKITAFSDANVPTYAAPVAIPGAVNLSLDANGDQTTFRADNMDYYVAANNNGYSGSLEVALLPDAFRKDILGEVEDTNGVLVEVDFPSQTHFALLFQIEGDVSAARHVMYNCVASRPSTASQTTDTTIEPVTESIDITASAVHNASLNKDIVKAKVYDTATTQYNAWNTTVYVPA